MIIYQMDVLGWEQADLPWFLPAYVSEFSPSLAVNRTWIMKGATMTAPSTLPKPPAMSDGKSEVRASNVELLSLQQVVLKVRLSDDVRHILDKGAWAATPVVCQGWKIYVKLSCLFI